MLDFLQSDPQSFFLFMLYRAPAVLIALTLHELAHGYVAYLCGDNTAKVMGRLSLNPLRHLDPVGTVLMFLLGFGYAKPVPVNPANFRHGRRDDLLVSVAGVTVNFVLFVLATLACVGTLSLLWKPELFASGYPLATRLDFLSFDGRNFWNTLYSSDFVALYAQGGELYGLDAGMYMQTPWLLHVQRFFSQFALCNLGMCLFNLLPIPPLDGFHVVNDVLLRGKLRLSPTVFRVCMLALLAVSYFTNILSGAVGAALDFVQSGVLALLGVS